MLKLASRSRPVPEPNPFSAATAAATRPVEWALEGWACAERGDWFGALRCFQHSLEGDMDCTEAWTGLAEVFQWMGDPKRSASCLEVARLLGRRSAPEARA
ncbi:MAG: hypothetical protein ACRD6R_01575 [Candidatus Polarisedimenticolia bacterium]